MKANAPRKLRTQVGTLEAIKSPFYVFVQSGSYTKVYDVNYSTGAGTFLGYWVNGQIVSYKELILG